MNRLYVAEPTPTPTGTLADHRLAQPASRIGALLAVIAAELGIGGASVPAGLSEAAVRWARAAARDLAAHRGRGLIVVGDWLPPAAHAVAHAVNAELGNLGRTAIVTDAPVADPVDGLASLGELIADLEAGAVRVLILSGVNPVYDAPADLGVAAALNRPDVVRVHHGQHFDETAELCQWHVPATHFLESWGDGRAIDGTVTLQQPLIEPLYGGKSLAELLAVAAGRGEAAGYDLVRATWSALSDEEFRRALHDGFVAGTAAAPVDAAVGEVGVRLAELEAPASASGYELTLRPDPALADGRYANNGWLQELPKPITKLTWGNALLMAPATAERLEVGNEQLVEVESGGRRLTAPAWILPGQAENTVTLHLGHGRRRAGRVGDGVGVDAYSLQATGARWGSTGVALVATRDATRLASAQGHYSISSWLLEESVEAERRQIVREATLEEFRADPEFVEKAEHELDTSASFGPGFPYEGYSWGMTIDLNSCTGCNACVVACQAENNIPVVGKEQVRLGREMQWIRIDRYFKGGIDEPAAIVSQPVPCMQCEQAPCETVCPVAATVHSSEGLNDMVYNRCVGTRYCSNNCPYKVRRFNFLLYADWQTEQLQLARNPDVTVRSRGVMEKCTYCVQRINQARITAEKGHRRIRDGEVVTACQQACPSHAIEFGDLNDERSEVVGRKADPRNYALLAELGTRPRTTYLALVRNPNPELVG
jgi:molybdopterin-containing oxidoreductase family iron-sulfur binding subunit